MKSLLLTLLLVGGTAMADTTPSDTTAAVPHLSCTVPVQNGPSTFKVEVSLGSDASVDFVTLAITGPNTTETLFIQMDKGAFADSLKNGAFNTLILQETVAMVDGVYKNAGIISVQKDASGVYTGVMAALGNIYPLSCK